MPNSKFRFLEDIATADLAFEAFGKNYSELFENAGLALESAQVDLETVQPSVIKRIKLEADSPENLLFAFLEELIFLKDAENLLFNRVKCRVSKSNGKSKWILGAIIIGEKIDSKKHKLGVDVKAVTKHLFKIENLPDKTLRCQVILDV